MNKNLQKLKKKGVQEYDEITTRNNQHLTNLLYSTQVDSSIVVTVSNLLNDKNKKQFSSESFEGSSNLFTINPTNPQEVLIKGSKLTYLSNGNTYDLNNPDRSYYYLIYQLIK